MVTSQSISPFVRKRKRTFVESSSITDNNQYKTDKLVSKSPYSMQTIYKHENKPHTRRCTTTARSLQHYMLESDESSADHNTNESVSTLTSDGWNSIEYEEFIAEILLVREDLSLFLSIILELWKDLSNEDGTSQFYGQQLQVYAHQISKYENNHANRNTDELCNLISLIFHELNCFHWQHLDILDLQGHFVACRDRFFHLLVKKQQF